MPLSDSNRLPPGTGSVDFADALAALKAVGFDRYLSTEIAQNPDSKTAAAAAFACIDYILLHVV